MNAAELIEALALSPHPEGGWYRETFRDRPAEGAAPENRGALTQIYFLLCAGERSRWHRIDAIEVWHFYAGDPLELSIAAAGEAPRTLMLGTDFARGEQAHGIVPAGAWQAARPMGRFALAGCTVAPAFAFAGFELAPDGWAPPLDPVAGER
ncbi:MAG: cupin domain-containing protein [Rhodospirillales bacterium]|nr:cupin domain-containing protein [Rhodospirillales bacterium]